MENAIALNISEVINGCVLETGFETLGKWNSGFALETNRKQSFEERECREEKMRRAFFIVISLLLLYRLNFCEASDERE